MSQSSLSASTGFLDIPLELRRHIYQYCLLSSDPIVVRNLLGNPYNPGKPQNLHPNILRVSKQIGHEAQEVLYGSNIFLVSLESSNITSLEYVFTAANRLKIRKLQLVIHNHDQIWQSMRFRQQLWSPILCSLKILSIVVKQPFVDNDPTKRTEVMEQRLRDWLSWMRPMMAYIAEHLTSSTHVEVDHDDKQQIAALMDEVLPGGY